MPTIFWISLSRCAPISSLILTQTPLIRVSPAQVSWFHLSTASNGVLRPHDRTYECIHSYVQLPRFPVMTKERRLGIWISEELRSPHMRMQEAENSAETSAMCMHWRMWLWPMRNKFQWFIAQNSSLKDSAVWGPVKTWSLRDCLWVVFGVQPVQCWIVSAIQLYRCSLSHNSCSPGVAGSFRTVSKQWAWSPPVTGEVAASPLVGSEFAATLLAESVTDRESKCVCRSSQPVLYSAQCSWQFTGRRFRTGNGWERSRSSEIRVTSDELRMINLLKSSTWMWRS